MKKVLVNILCAFIPSKFLRNRLRLFMSNNQVFIIDNDGKERKLRLFEFKKLKIGFKGKWSSNNIIKIHKSSKIKGEICLIGCNNKITISDGVSFNGVNIYALGNSELVIGKDCMFSWNVSILTNDGHKMFDKETEKPLSIKSKLVIGNHCWVGCDSTITKNGSIPDNTIVGTKSVVSKKFEKEYTAIAGNPAKVIKEDIRWER